MLHSNTFPAPTDVYAVTEAVPLQIVTLLADTVTTGRGFTVTVAEVTRVQVLAVCRMVSV
jgi:Zn-dependent alcohol dehydrogenase